MHASRSILTAVARSPAAALADITAAGTTSSWAVSSPLLLHRSRAWRSARGGISHSSSSAPSRTFSDPASSPHTHSALQTLPLPLPSAASSQNAIITKLETALRSLQCNSTPQDSTEGNISEVQLDSVKRKRRKKMRKHKLKKLRKVQRSERQRLKK
ncbi:hypothetical protein A4X13_0g2504 [Tilletia indica]|uniref:Small ribosomal subunit protein mS38 n=1 Tax=Tilletia indica TaxID=43049 RepID=A0A177TF13_9BASI|nr:hypothetical protein A4X13_0g2504 [Tilletia indica]